MIMTTQETGNRSHNHHTFEFKKLYTTVTHAEQKEEM